MSALEVVVLGSGKRVLQAALPALESLAPEYRVRRVFARTAKRIEVGATGHDVAALEGLTAGDLAGVGLVYMAVAKGAVPEVLRRLTAHDIAGTDLFIDTPVLRFKHFRHVDLLARFRNVWVSEDCTALPWFDTVRAAIERGGAGALQGVRFDRAAYAYHGVACAKALMGATRIAGGRRRRLDGGRAERVLRLPDGRRVEIVEPRDYSSGHVELVCANRTLSDRREHASEGGHLEPVVAGGLCTGFRVADVRTELLPAEAELTRGDPQGASVIARQDAMKRVGLRRMFASIRAGRGSYPLDQALEDMVVDYHLEKFGRYIASPLTSPHSGLARLLLKTVSRLGG